MPVTGTKLCILDRSISPTLREVTKRKTLNVAVLSGDMSVGAYFTVNGEKKKNCKSNHLLVKGDARVAKDVNDSN